MSEREIDVVVIGAGPAGENAAGRLAEGGLEVAIVERELLGGECSYWACMPSKALLRPAQALGEARRVPGAGEAVAGELDVGSALLRRDEIIHALDDSGQVPWLEERGVAVVRAEGCLEGERRVRAGDEVLTARRAVVLASGTTAALPPIEGLEAARPVDQPRGDHREGGAGAAGGPRWRRGRSRARAGMGLPGLQGRPPRGDRHPHRARGAFRE